MKKKAAKPVVEAVLAELARALAAGQALNLPPLGKLAVSRTRDGARAEVMVLKLRRQKAGAAPAAPAEPAGEATE